MMWVISSAGDAIRVNKLPLVTRIKKGPAPSRRRTLRRVQPLPLWAFSWLRFFPRRTEGPGRKAHGTSSQDLTLNFEGDFFHPFAQVGVGFRFQRGRALALANDKTRVGVLREVGVLFDCENCRVAGFNDQGALFNFRVRAS